MANRRMISSDTWRDEYIGSLDLFGRVLWVGLITTCADDQGRILNNPRLIRSDVFPFDEFSTEQIERSITLFRDANKIIIYEADGKSLIQIVNWWQYQTPSWASPSKYPAPDGWTDREKYHTVGNKIAVRNWDCQGGFQSLRSGYIGYRGEDVKGDVKGDGEGESENTGELPPTPPPTFDKPELAIIHEVTGLIPDIASESRVVNNVQSCRRRLGNVPRGELIKELTAIWDGWKSSRTVEGRLYDPGNWAWTDWAAVGRKGNGAPPGGVPIEQAADPRKAKLERMRGSNGNGKPGT